MVNGNFKNRATIAPTKSKLQKSPYGRPFKDTAPALFAMVSLKEVSEELSRK